MPESITTFEVKGVAMNSISGLGLSEKPAEVRVFIDFFVAVDLPYNCKRGEVVPVIASVFSYLSRNQTVTVSFGRNDDEFAVMDPAINKWSSEIYTNKI
jgi:hypothetical protein